MIGAVFSLSVSDGYHAENPAARVRQCRRCDGGGYLDVKILHGEPGIS
ncbi:MAG: hypothetical protein ABSC17_09690 [Thermacetogeniaceae bacterium]